MLQGGKIMEPGINLILGTMTFGEQVFGTDVRDMLQYFMSLGHTEIDTAYVYNHGESERLIGAEMGQPGAGSLKIATKVNPRITGRLDKEAVLTQFTESLIRMNTDHADTLYLHFPDPATPMESALEACAGLYGQGKFRRLGLSNFPAWMVSQACHICESHGWMRPSVYEGLYNALSRNAERELDSALTHYGMSFYAYNPLAGGILTDKYSGGKGMIQKGRFTYRPNYQQRYWKESYFEAAGRIRNACGPYDIGVAEAAYRWLAYHSMLKPERGDGIIIGASRPAHLKQNMAFLGKGKLPEDVAQAVEEAWEISRADAPEYFTLYTAPGRQEGGRPTRRKR